MSYLSSSQKLLTKLQHLTIGNSLLLLMLHVWPCIVAAQNSVTSLEIGTPIERDLSGGQTHTYRLLLSAGYYVQIIVEQRGIDVAVKLFGPEGGLAFEVDRPNGSQGPEPIFAIAKTTGSYRVEVRCSEREAPAGRYRISIEKLRKAVEQDKKQIAAELAFNRATLMRVKGTAESLQSAIKAYEQTLSLYREAQDQKGEASTLMSIGEIYSSLGEKQRALVYFDQALSSYRAVGDRGGEAETLNNFGVVYDDLGDRQKALAYYEQALPLRRLVRSPSGEAVTLTNIGVVYGSLGQGEKALAYFGQALVALRASGDRRGEAATLSNIGGIYADLGDKQKALANYGQALALARTIGERRGEAVTLSNIGNIHKDLGDKQKALEYYRLALPVRRQVGDRDGEAATLFSIGAVYDDLGEQRSAIDYYNQALTLYRIVGNRYGEAAALGGIGLVYQSSGQKEQALGYLAESLPIKHTLGDLRGEAATLTTLMALYQSIGITPLAIFYGKEAVDVLQQMRLNIRGLGTDVQKTYVKSIEFTYRGLIDLLITERRPVEALEVLTVFKDQQFFDFDRPPVTRLEKLTRTSQESDFALDYRKSTDIIGTLGSQVAEFKGRLGVREPTNEEARQLQKLDDQLKTKSEEFSVLLKRAETEFAKPISETATGHTAQRISAVQTILRQLDEQTGEKSVAVYTIVGVKKFRALIVTGSGVISVSPSIAGTEVNEKARQLWLLMRSPDYDPRELSHELYNAIFKPIEAELPKETKTIMWSLDGNLHYLPMAALYDGKHYLVERYNNVVFTRAEPERLTRKVSPTWTGYGYVNSAPHKVRLGEESIEFNSLDYAKDEMQVFRTKSYSSGIIDGDIFAETEFTKASLLTPKEIRPLVHISSHFRFRPGDEFSSFLLLGDGQVFTLAEMKVHANLFQGVELLTLSACDTAAQRADANGKEIDAFAELAQRLGAGSVIASLWPVLDTSTAELMKTLYKNRQGGRYSKAEALRQAQLALLHDSNPTVPLPNASNPRSSTTKDRGRTEEDIIIESKYRIPFKVDKNKPFAHPFYWSPFVLFGNWK